MTAYYVDPNSTAGGDGTTLNLTGGTRAFVSMKEAADTITAGGTHTIQCRTNGAKNQDDDDGATNTALFDSNVTITVSPHADDVNDDGIFDSGKYFIDQGSGFGDPNVKVTSGDITFDNIQFRIDAGGNYGSTGINVVDTGTVIKNCIFTAASQTGSSVPPRGVNCDTACTIQNCHFVDIDGSGTSSNYMGSGEAVGGIGIETDNYHTPKVYYCTFKDCGYGLFVDATSGGIEAKNNVFDCVDQDSWDAGGTNTFTNNYSTQASGSSGIPTGSNNAHSQTFTYEDATSNDHRLASGSAGEDDGTNIATVSDDMFGNTRHATTPDLGYYEIQAGGTTHTVSISEGAKAGDTQAVAVTWAVALSEGAKAGDTDTGIATYVRALLDGAQSGDTYAAVLQMAVAISEGAKAGDSWVGGLSLAAALADGAKAGDAWSAQVLTLVTAALDEGSKAGDAFVAAYTLAGVLTDGAKASDAFAAIATFLVDVAEGADASDTWTATATIVASLSEGAVAGDTWTVNIPGALVALEWAIFAPDQVFRQSAPDAIFREAAPDQYFRLAAPDQQVGAP